MALANPVLVEVTRGTSVESRHRGVAVVADARGTVVAAWGDPGFAVFPRSAIKPLQALPLIETGAAERFQVTDAEVALACASHGGEPIHVAQVARWLARIGLSPADLECGAHPPSDPESAAALTKSGAGPTALHNNCSGKHTGMLATARHLGEPTAGYVRPDHPVQQRLVRLLAELGGVDLAAAPHGIDGCGIPVMAMPAVALARAMARLADFDGLSDGHRAAAARVLAAMAAHPYLVGGRGRFDTEIMEAARGTVAAKGGAEGVQIAILPKLGLGVAIKIEDGNGRAAPVALAAILKHLDAVPKAAMATLDAWLAKPVVNAAGRVVGAIRPARDWLRDVVSGGEPAPSRRVASASERP
jgi:L-asparaginase II